MVVPEKEWWEEIFLVVRTLSGISNCPLCFEEKAMDLYLLKEERVDKDMLISELKYIN